MLLVDLFAYASDFLTPLFVEGIDPPAYDPGARWVRSLATASVAGGWAAMRFLRPGRGAVLAIETGATLGLALVYVHIADAVMTGEVSQFGPVFAMFGILLLLSARAALVPSPLAATLLLGIAVLGCYFVLGRSSIAALPPSVVEGIVFIGGAFVLVTSVTSHVIYGLRREVRRARQLGQYTLQDKLGEGGMGEVYRARHGLLRREAAIKLIRPELLGDASRGSELLRRFEREAHVTAGLRSPHTVELYDFGVADDGAFYYVMELLPGINLESAVQRYGPMPAERVTFLLRQACESLQEAHAAGLVHRDVKPANLFLCRYGLQDDFVKVLDFGLVGGEPQRGDAAGAEEAARVGTPAYLAPEQARGDRAPDGRADVYALGCTAYRLLTGQVPFERETVAETIRAHVGENPVPPSRRSEVPIPPEMDEIVLACLAKDPDDRPPSAEALAERLAALQAVLPEPWTPDRARRWWDTHRPESGPPGPQDDTRTVTVVRTEP